jgi:hypothetical protein
LIDRSIYLFFLNKEARARFPTPPSVPSFAHKIESQFLCLVFFSSLLSSYPCCTGRRHGAVSSHKSQDTGRNPTRSSTLTVSGEAKGRLGSSSQLWTTPTAFKIFPSAGEHRNVSLLLLCTSSMGFSPFPFGINSRLVHSFRNLFHSPELTKCKRWREEKRNI